MQMPFLSNALEITDLYSVFMMTLVEKFIPILPSYVMLPAIGMSATSIYDLTFRWLLATLGSICGALGWYMLGYIMGPERTRNLVRNYGKWLFLKVELYDKIALSYQRKPFFITSAGQLLPVVRTYQALPAGVLKLPIFAFLAATAVGAQVWIIALTSVGYFLN